MSVITELLALAHQVDAAVELPVIRRVYVPEPEIAADKDAEFGLLELGDGSAGLFYAWLGDSQRGISARYCAADLVGASVITLAAMLEEGDDMARSIGLAAVNAITQSVFRRAAFVPARAADSCAGLKIEHSDHLGMIGYFPSLVRRARERGVRVTVVERKTHLLHEEVDLRVTLDPRALTACNKIICTAAMVINGSVDDMLQQCQHAAQLVMIGPSAGFFPDPLFARGVDALGGTQVADAGKAITAQRGGSGLGDSSRRYTVHRSAYPGFARLLERVAEGT